MRSQLHSSRVRAAAFLLLPGMASADEPTISATPPPTPIAAPTGARDDTEALQLATHVAEAASRFGIPRHWIWAVIDAESAGDPRAVSAAGAMGLMQVMPGTWAELRNAHGLGGDPFDPRDNVLAGTAYLRQLLDVFGTPGFLAAYHAGPARYEDFLTTRRPLPRETRDYVAALAPLIGGSSAGLPQRNGARRVSDWREAPLFAVASRTTEAADDGAPRALPVPSDGLFVTPQSGRIP